MTIYELVKGNIVELMGLDQPGLNAWAAKNSINNRGAFATFKKALMQHGIDYNAMKHQKEERDRANLDELCEFEITLYCDAKQSTNRYGITDRNGLPVWHGQFFTDAAPEHQADAELEAAKKAVWLAGKVKEELGLKAIELNLYVDAEYLCYQDHYKQKGYVLTIQAKKTNVKLNVRHVAGTDNPADKWTVERGFKKWNETDLRSLVVKI